MEIRRHHIRKLSEVIVNNIDWDIEDFIEYFNGLNGTNYIYDPV